MAVSLYMVFAAIVIACGGIPKGYDEGGFAAAVGLKSFQTDYHTLSTEWKNDPTGLANRSANITSFGVLGAAFGSLLAILLTDRLGRVRTWQCAAVLWATGIFMQIFSSGIYGFLLFARIWGGLGAGALTVVTPLYLGEIAVHKYRGFTMSLYMLLLLFFLSLGFFINYGANLHMASNRLQYRLVMSIPLIPVGIAFFLTFFLDETPRYYAANDLPGDALRVLARLRGLSESDPLVVDELTLIQAQIRENAHELKGATPLQLVKETWANKSYRYRYLSALVMQTVAQWSGGNGITYYIPQIFMYAGVSGSANQLLSSGVYGLVKLLFTVLFAFVLIDFFGRRNCMLVGLFLQFLAHIYMSVYMGLQPGDSTNVSASDAAIASIYIYAVGWSIGLCTIPYIYSAEIFPTRIRSVCYCSLMWIHWMYQFAVVRVTPNMFVGLDIWGAFVFWACVCGIGLVLLGIMIPETKGIAMEEIDALFAVPWYKEWRARRIVDQDRAEELVAEGKIDGGAAPVEVVGEKNI